MDKNIIYIVSGLPRSGTSMVMNMLKAGGIAVLADNERRPDMDNPAGYFEYKPVTDLAKDARWVHDIEGKSIKVISHLLPYLPKDRTYKLLFMLRPIEEVLASQAKMLKRRGESFDENTQADLARKFKAHLYTIRLWIARQPHMECLFLHYADIIGNPKLQAERIQEFIGRPCNAKKMASVVDSRLYRNRSESL